MKDLAIVNPFPGQTDDVKIDASRMTILEIICVLGHQSILQYLLKDLQVRHNRDFCQDRHSRSIDQQKFVFVPILKKDEQTLAALLELTNLWTLQDLCDMMLLCKQMKWAEGIETVLRSKSCHRQYLTVPNWIQNQFLNYVTKIPYQQIDDVEDDDEATAIEATAKQDIRVTADGKKILE